MLAVPRTPSVPKIFFASLMDSLSRRRNHHVHIQRLHADERDAGGHGNVHVPPQFRRGRQPRQIHKGAHLEGLTWKSRTSAAEDTISTGTLVNISDSEMLIGLDVSDSLRILETVSQMASASSSESNFQPKSLMNQSRILFIV